MLFIQKKTFRIHHLEKELLKYFTWKELPSSPFLGVYQITDADYLSLKKEGTFYKIVMSNQRENILVRSRDIRVRNSIKRLSEIIDKELKKR